ncbi:MAG: response regulator [Candidatus Eisenbacteria bacterium]|uniref:histidine kinase n=1 Tax=Eiseniibacteriota bacterium TaxID=2212470 RepID=A0A538T9K5_UNCEI|nr:MAG: response regulator [Candidatus Eisenbacteria bacterium]
MPNPRLLKGVVASLAVAVVYLIAGKIGLSLAFVNASATAVWPPTGIALAAFLILGYRVWPGVLLGAFLANLTTAGNAATSAGIGVGNTLEGLLGSYLVQRFAGGRRVFEQPNNIFKFAGLAGIVSTAVSATIGVTTLSLGGFAPWKDFGVIWWTWWLGDASGALVVAPLAVLWWLKPKALWSRRQIVEAGLLLFTLAALALFVFHGMTPFEDTRYPLQYFCLPPLVWVAFRFGPRESTTAIALLSTIATLGTLQGFGPFSGRPPNESLLLLQGFMAVVSIMILAMSAAVTGRRRIENSVRRLNEELEQRVLERTGQLWISNQELHSQVAKRARAQEKLEKSEARLREAQRAARMGSWEWDIDRNVVWWSDELCSIYGLDPTTFGATYEGFLERVHPDDREHARTVVSTAVREKHAFSFEHRIVRPDGSVRVLLDQGGVLTDGRGKPIRMIGTGQDITEHKRAENARASLAREQAARREAEEANRLKDEFLATLSHELRTPLNAIAGWANLLREGQLDPATTARAVETINRNVRIQSHLISDILDISRMAVGRLELKVHAVNLVTVVEGAIDTMRPMAQTKNVVLSLELVHPTKPVLGDPDRLHQVASNLLSNAIKFSPEGGRVTVFLEQERFFASIRVEDDGPGIDPEFLPYVFDRFRQRDSSGTRKHGGLGLGLAIVRHIVDLHRGTVSASNRVEEGGAVFVVTLPLAEVPALRGIEGRTNSGSLEPAGKGDDHSIQSLGGTRILLVEDDPDSRELLAMVLSRCGADIVTVSSCRDALSAVASRRPDLLISDIAMPGESGYDLIGKLRSLSAEHGGTTPAVALSAYAGAEDASRALRAGFDVHVAKPVEMADLVRIVKELMGDRDHS